MAKVTQQQAEEFGAVPPAAVGSKDAERAAQRQRTVLLLGQEFIRAQHTLKDTVEFMIVVDQYLRNDFLLYVGTGDKSPYTP